MASASAPEYVKSLTWLSTIACRHGNITRVVRFTSCFWYVLFHRQHQYWEEIRLRSESNGNNNKILLSKLAEKERDIAGLQKFQDKYADMESKLSRKSEDFDHLSERFSVLSAQHSQLVAKHELEVANASSNYMALQRGLAAEAQLAASEQSLQELHTLRSQHESLTNQHEDLSEKYDKLYTKCEKIGIICKSLSSEQMELSQQYDNVMQRCASLTAERDGLISANAALRADINLATESNQKLVKEAEKNARREAEERTRENEARELADAKRAESYESEALPRISSPAKDYNRLRSNTATLEAVEMVLEMVPPSILSPTEGSRLPGKHAPLSPNVLPRSLTSPQRNVPITPTKTQAQTPTPALDEMRIERQQYSQWESKHAQLLEAMETAKNEAEVKIASMAECNAVALARVATTQAALQARDTLLRDCTEREAQLKSEAELLSTRVQLLEAHTCPASEEEIQTLRETIRGAENAREERARQWACREAQLLAEVKSTQEALLALREDACELVITP